MKTLLCILLMASICAAQPVDSVSYSVMVNDIEWISEQIFIATDEGIPGICAEPTNALALVDGELWSVSSFGYLQHWALDGTLLGECRIDKLPADNSPLQLHYTGLCNMQLLCNMGIDTLSGIWNVGNCNLESQWQIPNQMVSHRGVMYDGGRYWIGQEHSCLLQRITPDRPYPSVDSTLDLSRYGSRLLAACAAENGYWIAFEQAGTTKIYHFIEILDTSDNPQLPQEQNVRIWPIPSPSLAETYIDAEEFTIFDILGRKAASNKLRPQLPAGIFFVRTEHGSGKLIIQR